MLREGEIVATANITISRNQPPPAAAEPGYVLATRIGDGAEVTAHGRLRVCNSSENADLLWASRGGGGGNFGLVTGFTFCVHPVNEVAYFSIAWPWAQARAVVAAWQAWAPHVPDELSSVCNQTAVEDKSPGSLPRVNASAQFFGTQQALTALLQPLLRVGTPT